jgi:hypothetical protein
MEANSRLRIVVLGMMGRCPFGGQTWLYLNWLRGLARLGHEVWYVEDDSTWPFDPAQNTETDDCVYALCHLETSLKRIGFTGHWAFRLVGSPGVCRGLSEQGFAELYRSADVLLNVVGAVDLNEDHLRIPVRVYVQTDPVTCELRLANGDEHTRTAFDNHTHLFTYGENYGAADCGVPLNGRTYGKTRQPIDLALWPYCFTPDAACFTTIGNYRQSGSDVSHQGETYRWSKHHEWEKFAGLPGRVAQPFELALNVDDPADVELLVSQGWSLVSPLSMSLDIFGAYPDYFRRSRGEFTVAKDQNVRLRSGWFSERDVCYLASGKPVVTQDTGFSAILPTGDGLFGFLTMEEAVEAIERINSDYERHAKAARAVAEEYFDAAKVARRLLADVGAAG